MTRTRLPEHIRVACDAARRAGAADVEVRKRRKGYKLTLSRGARRALVFTTENPCDPRTTQNLVHEVRRQAAKLA
jgi:hypothetical protein